MTYYARSIEGEPEDKWQRLEDHLREAAQIAASFAKDFDAENWGYNVGIWHDLGKYSKEFQNRLRGGKRVDHSTAGAMYADQKINDSFAAKMIGYAVAGHHSGLMDGLSTDSSCLERRLQKKVPEYNFFPENVVQPLELTKLPIKQKTNKFGFQLAFFIRMLFSSVVDSDRLNSEKFADPQKAAWRKPLYSIKDLNEKLTKALKSICKNADSTDINKMRASILKDCLDAAEKNPGLFTLTVPTGGGKTLSSLAFALKHAIKFNKKRVIYVIPYTSIIEQNAKVFRKVLGKDSVLEHHSNYDPKDKKNKKNDDEYDQFEMAAENWDTPLIVTTNVQFFESLFNAKTSRARKIHNIANSVVILDEAQMLPLNLLIPCLEALKELSVSYNTSIVFCTATMPAFSKKDDFKYGLDLDTEREIVSNPIELYEKFKRVDIKFLSSEPCVSKKFSKMSDDSLAEKLIEQKKALCIVNTRAHARKLFEKIKSEPETYHLSARMCPAHRTEKIEKIKDALIKKDKCIVVSTQLIEAGVDVDFPSVFRSMSGIDSIAQAAGRCNREGKMQTRGKVFIFTPEESIKSNHIKDSLSAAERVIRHHDDILSLDAVKKYFQELFWKKDHELDQKKIMSSFEERFNKADFPFKEVSDKFKLIDNDNMNSIIIRFNSEADSIIEELKYSDFLGKAARAAQKFTVQIYSDEFFRLQNAGVIESIRDRFYILTNESLYTDDLGLFYDDPTFLEAERCIQ